MGNDDMIIEVNNLYFIQRIDTDIPAMSVFPGQKVS